MFVFDVMKKKGAWAGMNQESKSKIQIEKFLNLKVDSKLFIYVEKKVPRYWLT